MKVKVGGSIYDSTEEPIMLVLGTEDKQNIADMLDDKYLSYPEGSMSQDEITDFMDLPKSPRTYKQPERASARDKVVVHHEHWHGAASIGDFVAVVSRYDDDPHIELRKRDNFGRLVKLPETLTKQDALNLAELLVAAVK